MQVAVRYTSVGPSSVLTANVHRTDMFGALRRSRKCTGVTISILHTFWIVSNTIYWPRATSVFSKSLAAGYNFWKAILSLPDGTPRYYDHKTLPIDIQCSSQSIHTLVFSRDRDPEDLALAPKVANWTIDNMQDRTGYFYYRRYSPGVVNKTPTLHWGQATMLSALASLYKVL